MNTSEHPLHHPDRGRDHADPAEICDVVAPAFTVGGSASRDELVWTAMNAWAAPDTVALLLRLPDRYYWTVQDVREQLEASLTA